MHTNVHITVDQVSVVKFMYFGVYVYVMNAVYMCLIH